MKTVLPEEFFYWSSESGMMAFGQGQFRRGVMRRGALAIPNFEFVDMLVEMPLPRRFWSSHLTPESQLGFFEVEMQRTWRDVSERQEGGCKDWLDDKYLAAFCMEFATFRFVYSLCKDPCSVKTLTFDILSTLKNVLRFC